MSIRKQRRIRLILIGLALLICASIAIGYGFRNAIEYFKSPTQVVEEGAPEGLFRVGGLVKEGSVQRGEDDRYEFVITDLNADINVSYQGLVPDLFGEGQGAVIRGEMTNGIFVATEILAKHDENYMPREVIDALKAQGVFQESSN